KTAGAGLQNVEQLAEPLEALLRRLRILRSDGVVREQDGTVPQELVRGTRARAYLREMFLCCGFMSDPAARYHLEFRCSSLPQAEQLQGILEQDGIIAGRTRRRNYQVVYIKESESIVRLLQLMGASVNVMATENARILKELRNNVNRQVNCETANIGKTVESAARQREDIRLLRERGILQTLPAQLQEAAALREEYPGASLSELGKLTDPPVGRSGMNHRMRKLSALAQKAGQEGN
ncbi:MAG: DNA-binding protein WhiA, partial [Eubacteriales bacterium]|nr:DNA-binding protein WhiA [Eubacteriales bacterium]